MLLAGSAMWRYQRSSNQAHSVAECEDLGISFVYDYEVRPDGSIDSQATPFSIPLFGSWLGKDFFHSVVKVQDDVYDLNSIKSFSSLQDLQLDSECKNLHLLKEFSKLKSVISIPGRTDYLPAIRSANLESFLGTANHLDFLLRFKKMKQLRIETRSNDWRGLESLKNLELLEIVAYDGVDLKPISRLKNLKSLAIECSFFPDFSLLNQLEHLERIELYLRDMETDESLEPASRIEIPPFVTIPKSIPKNLKRIVIETDRPVQIQNLSAATGLETLKIHTEDQQNVDISFLFGLPNLTDVLVSASSFGPIKTSPDRRSNQSLQSLLISGSNEIPKSLKTRIFKNKSHPIYVDKNDELFQEPALNLTSFPILENLEFLTIEGVLIDGDSSMESFPNLQRLSLIECHCKSPVKDSKYLDELTNVPSRSMIRSLSTKKSLLHLSIDPFLEEDLAEISSLTSLKELYLARGWTSKPIESELQRLKPLEPIPLIRLKKLERLTLFLWPPKSLDFLSSLKNLNQLRIVIEQENDFVPIGKLTKIESLALWVVRQRFGQNSAKGSDFSKPINKSMTPLKNLTRLQDLSFNFDLHSNLKFLLSSNSFRFLNGIDVRLKPSELGMKKFTENETYEGDVYLRWREAYELHPQHWKILEQHPTSLEEKWARKFNRTKRSYRYPIVG